MSSSKTILALFVLLLPILQCGCSNDKLAKLETCHEEMKTISDEFLKILSTVNDEASAKKALPLLESTTKKMLASADVLDEAAKTTLRSASALKIEIANYRKGQKSRVDEQLLRIGEIPEAVEILAPLFEKYGL